MLVSPEFQGLDLPVHEPGTPVINRGDLQAASAIAQGPTFLRPAVAIIEPHGGMSLAEILDKTDKELDLIGGLCDATVVGHQWGLIPQADAPWHQSRIKGLPRGFRLVAEVETIVRAPGYEIYFGLHDLEISKGLIRYKSLRGTRLSDMSHRQFIHGSRRSEHTSLGAVAMLEEETKRWLLDIEPVLKIN